MNARSGLWLWLVAGCVLLGLGPVVGTTRAEGNEVTAVPAVARLQAASLERSEEGVFLRLAADADLTYKVFQLEAPPRLVIDLIGVAGPLATQAPANVPGLRAVRYSLWKPSATEPVVRYVIETSAAAVYRVEDGGQTLTFHVALPDGASPAQVPAPSSAPEMTAAQSSAPQPASVPDGPEPATTPAAGVEPAESSLRPVMVPLASEPSWVLSPQLEPTNLGELVQMSASAPVTDRTFLPLPTGGGDPGCMEVWGEALVLGAAQPEVTAPEPAPEAAVTLAPEVAVAPVAEVSASEPQVPTESAQPALTTAETSTELESAEPAGEPAVATTEQAAEPTADTPASADRAPADQASADQAVDAAPAAEPATDWPAATLMPSQLAAQDEAPTQPEDRVASADSPSDFNEVVEPVAPERVAFAEPAAEEVTGTDEPTTSPAPTPASASPDPFKNLIERHRAAAAARAHRDWSHNLTPHDSAPLLGQADADFPLAARSGQAAPMSLDVQGADIHTVLRSIAEYAGVNIVADTDVTGRITLRALDLPWPDMLQAVCRSMGLVAIDHGLVIRVATERVAQDETVARESAARKQEDYMPLKTRIVTMRYAQAGELKELISTMRGSRGQVEVDPRTNALILTDIEPRLDLLEQTLHSLDSQTMQVEITAEIVDVDFTAARELGITWGVDNFHSVSANASGMLEVATQNILEPAGTAEIGMLRSFGEVSARIEALANDNKADIISTPRITTVNNRQARILVGKEVPLITMDQAGNAITELKKVGITLEVTPYVNSEDQITLDLHPEVSDLSSQSTVQGGVVFTTTQADARVMVCEGETAVIGGLIRTLEGELERGVPFLKDVPVIGQLFKHTYTRNEKRELLIFVTPRLVRAGEAEQR
jgi:type IV pilus secretin PilQ/predicted competence protein